MTAVDHETHEITKHTKAKIVSWVSCFVIFVAAGVRSNLARTIAYTFAAAKLENDTARLIHPRRNLTCAGSLCTIR